MARIILSTSLAAHRNKCDLPLVDPCRPRPAGRDRQLGGRLDAREDHFWADIVTNRHNRAILDRWNTLALPDGWLVAGCLFQTVWNLRDGRAPEAGIKDYDLFYFDLTDTSELGEQRVQARVDAVLGDLGVTIEASNQARIHLWYETYFGHAYEKLRSARDGIDRFLVPATCVGVRPGELYAPNGLALLYEGILTMNPLTPHRELFERKVASYCTRWSWLRVISPGQLPIETACAQGSEAAQ